MTEFNLLDLMVRFGYNFGTAFIIIVWIYYPREKKREYLFTFFVFNMLIFFVCAFLKTIIVNIGFAFGLFAIFTILRYRTETIPIREMTYQFMVITLGAVNGLAENGSWHPELVLIDVIVIVGIFLLDGNIFFKEEFSQSIQYEKIDLIMPAKRAELLDDLRERTGLNIRRIKIEH
ncbi:MAG: DUF4956 domain-containing protein, partial [bacterium]|nr:DUF4956 domain-containing protein [bacterium]